MTWACQQVNGLINWSCHAATLALVLALLPCPAWAHGDLDLQVAELTQRILRRGELRRQHAELELALTDFAQARKLDRKLADVDFAEGRTLLDADRLAEARSALDRFLATQPDHPIGLWYRAQCLVRLDQRALADADFQRCFEVAPNPTPELVIARAANLEKSGDAAKALSVIEAGMERLGQISSLQLNAAEMEVRLGRTEAAIARMDRLIAEAARREALLFHKGQLLEEAGDPVAARASYLAAQTALETLPPTTRKTITNRALTEKIEKAMARLNTGPSGLDASTLPR
jgi:tetratricopeptide (TPR) repeat protein